MSLCDSCYAPGQCCKGFVLNGGSVGEGSSEEELSIFLDERDLGMLVPFKHNDEGSWHFNCSNLQQDGRCGDYENRPPMCKDMEPASDKLCVHWQGAEGDERNILDVEED